MDVDPDGRRLATAAGDRTSRITDIEMSGTTLLNLTDGHHDSLRQVKYQPGQGSGCVLATSDRVGCIQIWDIRCRRQVAGVSTSTTVWIDTIQPASSFRVQKFATF